MQSRGACLGGRGRQCSLHIARAERRPIAAPGHAAHREFRRQVAQEPRVLLDRRQRDALSWVGDKDARQQVLALGADAQRGRDGVLDRHDALQGQKERGVGGMRGTGTHCLLKARRKRRAERRHACSLTVA